MAKKEYLPWEIKLIRYNAGNVLMDSYVASKIYDEDEEWLGFD